MAGETEHSSTATRLASAAPEHDARPPIVDVDAATFERVVVEGSKERPVVVDFWADWCAPCRMLAPVLERAVLERGGRVLLAKVDVDRNPTLAARYGVRGIPAVKAFRDGRVVAEFTGAQPPAQVAAFLDSLLPSEADELAAIAARERDEAKLERALELDPRNPVARRELARLRIEQGRLEEAAALLREVSGDFVADGLAARVELLQAGDQQLVKRLRSALSLLAEGRTREALEALEALLRDTADPVARDRLRRVIVGVFNEVGQTHPLATEFRRRLASLLS